jgi:hypothetical protein
MRFFEKKKLIQTEWDNSDESTANFYKAIEELKKENIPFRVVHKRIITEYAKKLYITYSIILDFILVMGIIIAFLNLDKLIEVIQ